MSRNSKKSENKKKPVWLKTFKVFTAAPPNITILQVFFSQLIIYILRQLLTSFGSWGELSHTLALPLIQNFLVVGKGTKSRG
jgi:hypothetical protein